MPKISLIIKNLTHKLITIILGFDVRRVPLPIFPVEFREIDRSIIDLVKPFTMTPITRINALGLAVQYIKRNQIQGDVVECGVWAGGSIGAAALFGRGDHIPRKYWLYDTFAGMTEPGLEDGLVARNKYQANLTPEGVSNWVSVSETEVRTNLEKLGVDLDLCVFRIGDVKETLRNFLKPKQIALLRLDTDLYESTLAELQELYPLLKSGGVLIIDDYGAWEGARKAVDEYFSSLSLFPLLIPIDHTCRFVIKA